MNGSDGLFSINPSKVITEAQELEQTNENVRKVCDDINSYLREIEAAWVGDTDDRESYVTNTKNDITSLYNVVSTVKPFVNELERLAKDAIAASRNTMD